MSLISCKGVGDPPVQPTWMPTYILVCSCFSSLVKKFLHTFDIHLAVDLLENFVALLQAMEYGYFDEGELDSGHLNAR